MNNFRIITSVAPYVTRANALESLELAHKDGFGGVELNEDHLHCLVTRKHSSLRMIREYCENHHMVNSIHRSLHLPSLDSENTRSRNSAVQYTQKTIDYMKDAGISRIVLHSFSDLPSFFRLRAERANGPGYYAGCHAVKMYGLMAPAIKAYRKTKSETLSRNFLSSLSEIASYASDTKIGSNPIQVVFEEHYSDAIDYDLVSYGKGRFSNVIRGIDTAHQFIRTGKDSDLTEINGPIHFHAVDTNGKIDDHRTVGTGKVNFERSLHSVLTRRLTDHVVIEDGSRTSALRSKEALEARIRRYRMVSFSSS